jgi:transposase
MVKKPHISTPRRLSIVYHKRNGMSDREVAIRVKVPKTTVNRIFRLWRETGNIRRRKPPGRPKKITERLRRRLRRACFASPTTPSKNLAKIVDDGMETEISISPSRIREILVESGLKARNAPRKWVISKINRQKG